MKVKDDLPHIDEVDKEPDVPETNKEPDVPETDKEPDVPETETDTNHTLAEFVKQAAEIDKEVQDLLGEERTTPDISVGEDGGHFNKNKENRPSFSAPDEMQKLPQATLESPLDKVLGEMERSSSGWLSKHLFLCLNKASVNLHTQQCQCRPGKIRGSNAIFEFLFH